MHNTCLCSDPPYEKYIKKHGTKHIACLSARWNVLLSNTLGRRVLRVDDEEVIWKTAYS